MRVRLSPRLNAKARQELLSFVDGLPEVIPDSIQLQFRPSLCGHRGKLLSGENDRGVPVYAGAFLRERRIVLESELLNDRAGLRLILVHELFHFAWPRLGNARRRAYSDLLERECRGRVRGELGESAGVRKAALAGSKNRTRAWRDYVCESFCDSAAWLYAGVSEHPEFGLAVRWRRRRALWLKAMFGEQLRGVGHPGARLKK